MPTILPGPRRLPPTARARSVVLLLALVFGVSAIAAQDPPCDDPERSHEFDFWIGEWDVFAGEKHVGVNSIRPILDGCVLQETWRGDGGGGGSSLNFYNPRRGGWEQFWVWRNGTTLHLTGTYADGKMTLEGDSIDAEGKKVRNRITWHDNGDGTVRQHWETSLDAGKTWKTAFDGLYRKKR